LLLNCAAGSWWNQLEVGDAEAAKKVLVRQYPHYRELLDKTTNETTVECSASKGARANGRAVGVTVDEVAGQVTRIADRLQFINEALALPESGFYEALDLVKLEAIGYVVGSLADHVEGENSDPDEAAHAFLADFRERARVIAAACFEAQTKLDGHRGKRGPAPYDWFDPVTAAVVLICERNGIKKSISTDRITNEKGGRFLEVAERIEQLLPLEMCALTRDALAKRLVGSQKRLREASKSPPKKKNVANGTRARSGGSCWKD
jgi:hypothetical protein